MRLSSLPTWDSSAYRECTAKAGGPLCIGSGFAGEAGAPRRRELRHDPGGCGDDRDDPEAQGDGGDPDGAQEQAGDDDGDAEGDVGHQVDRGEQPRTFLRFDERHEASNGSGERTAEAGAADDRADPEQWQRGGRDARDEKHNAGHDGESAGEDEALGLHLRQGHGGRSAGALFGESGEAADDGAVDAELQVEDRRHQSEEQRRYQPGRDQGRKRYGEYAARRGRDRDLRAKRGDGAWLTGGRLGGEDREAQRDQHDGGQDDPHGRRCGRRELGDHSREKRPYADPRRRSQAGNDTGKMLALVRGKLKNRRTERARSRGCRDPLDNSCGDDPADRGRDEKDEHGAKLERESADEQRTTADVVRQRADY